MSKNSGLFHRQPQIRDDDEAPFAEGSAGRAGKRVESDARTVGEGVPQSVWTHTKRR